MCGRARLSSDLSEIKIAFRIPPERPMPNFASSWNLAPTDSVVRNDPKAGQRSLDMLRWGLIPYWSKDIKVGFANINAKAEGSRTSRHSAKRSSAGTAWCRSTTFMNGAKPRPGSSPMRSRSAERGIMALAGLWENWRSPAGEWVRSFAIVTTVPNQLCAEIHNRMPVILKPDAWPAWLGEEPADEPELKALLAPLPRRRHDLLAGQRARRQGQE
jgi:putative SOS response-associated peptidase YedK